MPQPKKGPRLGAGPAHQSLLLKSLARSLFEQERIRTTEAKAKMLRPYAEKLITKAKKGGVHQRRLVLAEIENRAVVHKLFDDIGPRFAERNGGYLRILKIGPRNGDAAPMALIELVEASTRAPARATDGDEAGGRRRRLRRPGRRRTETTAEEAVTEYTPVDEDADEPVAEAEPSDDDLGSESATLLEAEADPDAEDDGEK